MELILKEEPKTFVEGLALKNYDEKHVEALARALENDDQLPSPKVADVEGYGLCVLDGNHTLHALKRVGKPLKVVYLGSMDYASALKVVLESNSVSYKPPSPKEFKVFLSKAYLLAREKGLSRRDFILTVSQASGKSERTLYRLLKDVFDDEEESVKRTAVLLVTSGKTIKEVADVLGVSPATLKRWLQEKQSVGKKGALQLFSGGQLTQEFLEAIDLYCKSCRMPALDGLYVWLCSRFYVSPEEWKTFYRNAKSLLPAEFLRSLNVGEKVWIDVQRKERKEKEEEKPSLRKERRITLRGTKRCLLEVHQELKKFLPELEGNLRKRLEKTLKKVEELLSRVSLSLEPKSEEAHVLAKRVVELLNQVHMVKTGNVLVHGHNYGAYVRALRPACKTFLRRCNGNLEEAEQVWFMAIVYNAYGANQEWLSFLARAPEKLDELKHAFSKKKVWFKVLRKELTKQGFFYLLEEVKSAVQKLSESKSSSISSSSGSSSSPFSASVLKSSAE